MQRIEFAIKSIRDISLDFLIPDKERHQKISLPEPLGEFRQAEFVSRYLSRVSNLMSLPERATFIVVTHTLAHSSRQSGHFLSIASLFALAHYSISAMPFLVVGSQILRASASLSGTKANSRNGPY